VNSAIITLAIIDDDQGMLDYFSKSVATNKNLELIGTATSSREGLNLIKSCRVDAVLVDLVMPNEDGFHFLESLDKYSGEKRPACIIMSEIGTMPVVAQASVLGADHFTMKPFDTEVLFRRIVEICRFKNHMSSNDFDDDAKDPSQTRTTEDYIHHILNGLPINQSLLGYRYIKTALRLSIKDPGMLDRITKDLYPTIASNHKSSPSRVERAIRHAICGIWKKGGWRQFSNLVGVQNDERPSNGNFLAAIANRYHYFYISNSKSSQ